MIETWWPPSEIVFIKEQMVFLLGKVLAIRNGQWPPEPSEYLSTFKGYWVTKHRSGYISPPSGNKRVRTGKCPFTSISGIVSELDERLEKTYTDGIMLEARYGWDKSCENLANHFRITEDAVSSRIQRALNFISGWKRKNDYRQKW